MAHVEVVIGERPYRLACEAGEEAHLGALAAFVEGKIRDMRGAVADPADPRVVVMAALAVADALFEARAAREEERGRADERLKAAEARALVLERALIEAAARVEALTDSLTSESR